MQTSLEVKRMTTTEFEHPIRRYVLHAVVLSLSRVARTRDMARLTYHDLKGRSCANLKDGG